MTLNMGLTAALLCLYTIPKCTPLSSAALRAALMSQKSGIFLFCKLPKSVAPILKARGKWFYWLLVVQNYVTFCSSILAFNLPC